jgi:hypothetical protein
MLYETLAKTDEAITEFQSYLQLESDSAQRAEVKAEIAKLQGTQTTLTADHPHKESFVTYFARAKINGEMASGICWNSESA